MNFMLMFELFSLTSKLQVDFFLFIQFVVIYDVNLQRLENFCKYIIHKYRDFNLRKRSQTELENSIYFESICMKNITTTLFVKTTEVFLTNKRTSTYSTHFLPLSSIQSVKKAYIILKVLQKNSIFYVNRITFWCLIKSVQKILAYKI